MICGLEHRRKGERIINVLRRSWPERVWKYEWPSRWITDKGWAIPGYSVLCGYDDETSRTEYRRTDTGDLVLGLGLGGL